jgi:hypothetical protein
MKRSAEVGLNAPLIATHERCLAIMLSQELHANDALPGKVKFAAHLSLDNVPVRGWTITHSHLVFTGNIGEIKPAEESGESRGAAQGGSAVPQALGVPVMLGTSIF